MIRHLFNTTLSSGILVLVFLIASCSKQLYNFTWSSVIVDEETRQPVPFTSIYTKAFYQNNIDQSNSESYHVISNSNGEFKYCFNKAYQLEVDIKTTRYQAYQQTFNTFSRKLPDTIFIKRIESDGELFMSISHEGFTQNTPFISQKTIHTYGRRKPEQSLEINGYDFLEKERSSTVYDLGLNIKGFGNNKLVELITLGKGGIYPVYNTEISESFFLEMENAPLLGYQKSYRLKGTEAGFFIKCRDGQHFAKIILDKQLYQLQFNNEQDSIVELGLKFHYIIQHHPANLNYFPAISVLEQLNDEQLTSILDTVKILRQ